MTSEACPSLRPALKYEGEIYEAPLNGQHSDAIPAHLADEFQHRAMSGEDISKFSFGFINDKGDFLSREYALKYAIEIGLFHPDKAKNKTLTSSMLGDLYRDIELSEHSHSGKLSIYSPMRP